MIINSGTQARISNKDFTSYGQWIDCGHVTHVDAVRKLISMGLVSGYAQTRDQQNKVIFNFKIERVVSHNITNITGWEMFDDDKT